MKKIIIASLISVFTTSAFADHAVISFGGKKITMEDTRASLIKKLGKPQYGDKNYNSWNVNNLNIYATYNEYGLSDLSVSQNKPTPVSIRMYGYTINLGKDSVRTVASKFKTGCFNYDEGKMGSTYSFVTPGGAEGEYNVAFEITNDEFNLKSKEKQPINGVKISYDEIETNKGCTQ